MLLKLWAIPLASDPIICMRRARSKRVVSFIRSRSRNSRSIALATTSPASRTAGNGKNLLRACRTVSNPMMPRTRPGRSSGTHAKAPTPAAASADLTSPCGKAPTSGTVTMSGPVAPRRSDSCKARPGHPGRKGYSFRAPGVHPHRVFREHHVRAVNFDRPAELAEYLLQTFFGSPSGALIRRVEFSAMTCSNAARWRSASARARSRSPRRTSITSSNSETRYSHSRDRSTLPSTGRLAAGEQCTGLF